MSEHPISRILNEGKRPSAFNTSPRTIEVEEYLSEVQREMTQRFEVAGIEVTPELLSAVVTVSRVTGEHPLRVTLWIVQLKGIG